MVCHWFTVNVLLRCVYNVTHVYNNDPSVRLMFQNQRYMASIQSVVSPVAQPTGPKSVSRPKRWSEEVEEAYRFQIAGYRDVHEYRDVKRKEPDRWPHNGYVKKLQRKDGYFIYFDRTRECTDKDVYKCKLYGY